MKMTGNTILITGGGTGIGLALAREFIARGNTVIVTGRRQSALDKAVATNPGLKTIAADVTDAASVDALAVTLKQDYPALNVVINNAGIMEPEDLLQAPGYVDVAERTVATNVMGPIRVTAALLPQLRTQAASSVIMVTSGLAFVPLAMTPTYSATKAAVHSYTVGLRYQLRDTTTQVMELVPPYVQTELMGEQQASDPRAMPLGEFISEVMGILERNPDAEEVVVERCKPLRFADRDGKLDEVFGMLNSMRH